MEASISATPEAPAFKGQRRLRKGTHSCIECRRRKIRCSYRPGSSVCVPCSSRGSRCVDQRYKISQTTPNSALVGETTSPVEFPDLGGAASDIDHWPPIVNVLANAEILGSSKPGNEPLFQLQSLQVTSTQTDLLGSSKTQSVCTTLRSMLPSYDDMIATLSQHGAWWNSFRQKTHAITQAAAEKLVEFATRTYTSNNPAEVGMIVAAYARSIQPSHENLFTIVDNLVISDSAYAATIQGMECLILLAKCFTDIGQPRRAWYIWRKGMAIAQLMGLYREGPNTVERQRIWWVIYHGDRFASMLLGLPYGFNDIHYGPILENMASTSESLDHRFVLQCAFMGGKVIDRNIIPGTLSFAKAMELDEQMNLIATIMPAEWWDVPHDLSGTHSGLQSDLLRDRLLQQFYFFHVRMYIHLPFMTKSTTTSGADVSKLACTEAARQLLKRYKLLRDNVEGAPLFDCKTSDFVGFTATIVLLVGHSSLGKLISQQTFEDDLHTISQVEGFFNEKSSRGCQIAAQCQKTLCLLLNSGSKPTRDYSTVGELQAIQVPYFGVVVHRQVIQSQDERVSENSWNYNGGVDSSSLSTSSAADAQTPWTSSHTLEYLGYNLLNPFPRSEQLQEDSSEAFLFTDTFSEDLTLFDIDQDWGTLHYSN